MKPAAADSDRADEEADRRPPAERVVEAEQEERHDRDDGDRRVLAAQVRGGALLHGARDLLHPLVAGRLPQEPDGEAEAVEDGCARAQQREQHGVIHEPTHRLELPPGRHKVSAETPRRGLVFTTPAGLAVSRSGRAEVPANLLLEDLAHAAPSSWRAIWRSAAFRSGIASHSAAPSSSATGRTHSTSRSRRARAGIDSPLREVDQLAREAVADRAPEVLLEQAVRQVRQRLALVERARDPRRQRVAERGERARLAEVGLRVADPDLDRREREMRPHAPPDLRVLGDRAGLVEEADVRLPLVPACRARPGCRSAGTSA